MENKVWALAHAIFPLNVVGEASAVSEFGVVYRYWANGAFLDEGEAAPVWPADRAEKGLLDAVSAFFTEQRAAGNIVAVWREFPEFTRLPATDGDKRFHEEPRPARVNLIMRLHFMPWFEFKTAMEARV